MGLPTLLIKGNLTVGQKELPNEIPKDYIIRWVKSKMYEYGFSGESNIVNRCLIIKAFTGAAKSTTMVVELFRIFRGTNVPKEIKYEGKSVICLQPKILTAMSLATSIPNEAWCTDLVFDETIGYNTGAGKTSVVKGLIFATLGTLTVQLTMLEDADIMAMYSVIVVDEAHERTIDSDLLLMLLKNFYQRNKGNKNLPFLILASATFEPDIYLKYFELPEENKIIVKGITFPIETIWPKQDLSNIFQGAYEIIEKLVEKAATGDKDEPPERSDILVFLPGGGEIGQLNELLEKLTEKYPIMVLKLDSDGVKKQSNDVVYAQLPYEDLPLLNFGGTTKVMQKDKQKGAHAQTQSQTQTQSQNNKSDVAIDDLFDNTDNVNNDNSQSSASPDGAISQVKVLKRIIMSTNVAETGLTLDSLKYVIDSGWYRSTENYIPDCGGLVSKPCARSRVTQRRGRVGRKFSGVFYPLYTENTFNKFMDQQFPEIVTDNYASKHLLVVREQLRQKRFLKQEEVFKFEDINMLCKPVAQKFISANYTANVLGFLKTYDDKVVLTKIGEIASKINRMDMEHIKLILSSFIYGVALCDTIVLAAVMDRENKISVSSLIKNRKVKFAISAEEQLIKESFPLFIINKDIIGGDNNGIKEDEEYFYRCKLAVLSNAIELMIIYNKFEKIYEKSIVDAEEWCNKVNGDFNKFFGIMKTKLNIENELLGVGIDLEYNKNESLMSQPVSQFNITLKKLKKCIYEGFKTNILTYNEQKKAYFTSAGIQVGVKPILNENQIRNLISEKMLTKFTPPNQVITNMIVVEQNRSSKTLQYQLTSGLIDFI